jgi:hypothetical protein
VSPEEYRALCRWLITEHLTTDQGLRLEYETAEALAAIEFLERLGLL